MNINKIAEDLRILADDLEKMMAVGKEEEAVKPEEKEMPKEADKPKETKETKPAHTLEEVRAALAEKSKAGFTAQVRETIIRFGGNKLSDVPESNYDALYDGCTQRKRSQLLITLDKLHSIREALCGVPQ